MKIKIITTEASSKFATVSEELEDKVNKFTQNKNIIVHKIKLKKDFRAAAIYYKESEFK